jgi:hypothetical protein
MSRIKTFASAWLLLTASLLSPAQTVQRGVQGSPHDFSKASWNVTRDLCSPCHQEHSPQDSQIPMWGHATSKASFRIYDSPTFKAERHAPSSGSLACLSCHDGTVAINQSVAKLESQTAVYINPASQIGPDLHTTHPISFTYDASLAVADGAVENPMVYHIGDAKTELTCNTPPVPKEWDGPSLAGLTIDEALLFDHKLECASCHDVHNQQGNVSSGLLKIDGMDRSGRGDLLCRTCHIK